ncbi:MAG: hypothetical protein FWC03_05605 [Treponema sp.]|nr:hypothetical protein [Treponema sp.]
MVDAKARLANRERQRRYREANREKINEQRKERYNDRISNGKCPRCGGKIKKGYTLCTECCEYQANLNRKYANQKKKTAPRSAAKTAAAKVPAKAAAKKPAAKAKPAVKAKPAAKAKAKPAVKKPVKAKK